MPSSLPQALDYVRSTFEDRRSIFEFSLSWDPAAYDAAAAATDHQLLPAAFRRDMVQQRRWQRQVRGRGGGAGRRLRGIRGAGVTLLVGRPLCRMGRTFGGVRSLQSCPLGCGEPCYASARCQHSRGVLVGRLCGCGAAQGVPYGAQAAPNMSPDPWLGFPPLCPPAPSPAAAPLRVPQVDQMKMSCTVGILLVDSKRMRAGLQVREWGRGHGGSEAEGGGVARTQPAAGRVLAGDAGQWPDNKLVVL